MLLPAALLLTGAAARAAMTPPTMAYNVAPRPSITSLAVPGGGFGASATLKRSARDRARAGSTPAPNSGQESLETWRLSLQLDYELAPRLTGILVVPYAWSRFQVKDARQSYGALGDVVALGRWALRRGPDGELGALGGAKLPTGSTTESSGGVPLAATQQPGTGTTDFLAGLAGWRRWRGLVFYGDATYKYNLHSAYTFGDQAAADAGVQVPLRRGFSATAEVNAEYADKDSSIETSSPGVLPDGTVRGTGGTALYLTPGLAWRSPGGSSLSAGAQIPVYQHLNGIQLASGVNWTFTAATRLGGAR